MGRVQRLLACTHGCRRLLLPPLPVAHDHTCLWGPTTTLQSEQLPGLLHQGYVPLGLLLFFTCFSCTYLTCMRSPPTSVGV